MSDVPAADRPFMPGYGIVSPSEGSGLLSWAWAEERLAGSHDYWLATVSADGAPHLMPVWATWLSGALWFSSSKSSRKTRNLLADGRCSMSTDNAAQPVVVHGVAEAVADPSALRTVLDAENAKYGTDYSIDTPAPAVNTCFRVCPVKVIGLDTEDFTGSPTRWV